MKNETCYCNKITILHSFSIPVLSTIKPIGWATGVTTKNVTSVIY